MLEQITADDELSQWLRIDDLRNAVKANRIHFPVPVPVFPCQFRPDIQWRLVELYFVRGWSSRQLAQRYGVTARRIQQSLQHWTWIAKAHGYLQEIPPETAVFAPAVLARPGAAMPMLPVFSPLPVPVAPSLAVSPPA